MLAAGLLDPETRATAAAPGTISGHVTLATRLRGVPIATNAYAPRAVTQQAMPATPELRSVIVYLKDAPFSGPLPLSRTGEYSLVGWHERVGEYTTHTTVSSGQTTAAELSLPVTEAR